MDYIINPWWFYFVQICGTFKCMFYIFSAMFLFIGAFFLVSRYVDIYYGDSTFDSNKIFLTRFKRVCIIGAVIYILGALIPTENTLIKMQIAKFGTYSNAEKVLNVIDEKTDAIIDAIRGSKKD